MDSDDVQKITADTVRLGRGDDLQQKQVIGGRYEIISSLGEGGMGSVYKVNQIFLNKEFAFKTININHVSDLAVRRFQQEARTTFALDHPSIVTVNDFGVLDDQSPFLVMELVNGETLGERLKRVGCLTLEQAIPIFVQVCFGLAYAHERGVVHRDIKPSNIMLLDGLPAGTDGSVKIVDFGIAKFVQHDEGEMQALTRTGEIFGSPLYMSPEQCTGGSVDRRSDIYSLGCVFFETLTGAPPCLGDNALATMMKHQSEKPLSLKQASLGADFPQAIEDMVAKMLAKAPENRYQNLGIIAHELGAMRRGQPISATATQTVAAPTTEGQTAARTIGATAIAIPRNKIYALLIGTSLLSFVGGYELHQLQNRTLPVVNQVAADSNRAPKTMPDAPDMRTEAKTVTNAKEQQTGKWKALFAQAKPIKSEIVTPSGVRRKQFIFPDRSIGRISNLTMKGNSATNKYQWWEAAGPVLVPPDMPLSLEVGGHASPVILEIPSIMKKIGDNEFSELIVTAHPETNWIASTSDHPILLADQVAQILNSAANWSNLQAVTLKYVPATDALLNALANLKHLQNLSLREVEPTAGIAQQTFLRRLVFLNLDDMPVDDILRGLAGSPNLEYLALDAQVRSLSPDALQELGRCPHLKFLRIPQSTLDEQMILALRQIKSLRVLYVLGGKKLTPEQLSGLTGQSFALVR
jgi:serine/threonine protein kinase